MMRLRSRISGRIFDIGSEPLLPGLFEVACGDALPRPRVVQGGLETNEALTFLNAFPRDQDTAAVEKVVGHVGAADDFDILARALPIVPPIEEASRLSALDLALLRHLPHLQSVCHKPRMQLRVEEERVPVSRARRVPARAVASLVAHPEDWEHRTLRNVRPARLLSSQVEDQYDLYENRVAVRLVDHLLEYVGKRLEELRRIKVEREDAEELQDASRGSFWRARRMCELLGAYFLHEMTNYDLDLVIKKLENAQHDLQGLLGSVLYKEVPPNRFVAPELRPTNILVNDPHYRRVAELWRIWVRDVRKPHPTREQIRKQRQGACLHFDRFARLLVCRALKDLGYAVSSTQEGPTWALSAPHANIELRCLADGTIWIEAQGRRLHIVPVLTRAPSDATTAESIWGKLLSEKAGGQDTLIFVLGHPKDILSLPSNFARAFSGFEKPRIVTIAPWSLDSVERVARVLRSWEAPLRHQSYPLRAKVRPDPGIRLPNWLHRVGDEIGIVKPPKESELQDFAIDCAQKRTELERRKNDAPRMRQTWDPGILMALDALQELANRAGELQHLLHCPVCSGTGDVHFEPQPDPHGHWDRFAFRCVCRGCDARFALRTCAGSCNGTFLVLEPKVEPTVRVDKPMPASWVDQAFGRDIFAEPCWLQSDKRRDFLCPECGVCTGGGCGRSS